MGTRRLEAEDRCPLTNDVYLRCQYVFSSTPQMTWGCNVCQVYDRNEQAKEDWDRKFAAATGVKLMGVPEQPRVTPLRTTRGQPRDESAVHVMPTKMPKPPPPRKE